MRIESENINGYYNSHSQGDVSRKESNHVVEKDKIKPREMVSELPNNSDNKKTQEHEVIEAIEKANKHFKSYDRRLEFSIHEKTKQIMVKVINTDDDSIVREIPSEKILDMVAKLWEMSGIFVDEKR
ncbi:flagellar protein FlaG [Vallitalea sediminicola]